MKWKGNENKLSFESIQQPCSEKKACLEIEQSMDHLFSLLGYLRKWRKQNLERINSKLTRAKQKRKQMNIKSYQFTRQNQLLNSVLCGHGWFQQKPLWSVHHGAFGPTVWPAGMAIQALSFLTTSSRSKKSFRCMRPLQSVQCCNFRWFSLLYPVLSVVLWICWSFFTSSPNKLVKNVSELYLRCVLPCWQLWLLIWI